MNKKSRFAGDIANLLPAQVSKKGSSGTHCQTVDEKLDQTIDPSRPIVAEDLSRSCPIFQNYRCVILTQKLNMVQMPTLFDPSSFHMRFSRS